MHALSPSAGTPANAPGNAINVAMLLSCSSFEGFFGRIQGQTRSSYLKSYRNDWAWYYARGLLENGVTPLIYIPAKREAGLHETDAGIAVRFLPLHASYKFMEQVWLKRASRLTRWSLYVDERLNAMAFMGSLREALIADKIDLLYVQEYWSGRFDHLVHRVGLPVAAADHGGVWSGVVKVFKRDAFKKAGLCYSQTDDECGIVRRYARAIGLGQLHRCHCLRADRCSQISGGGKGQILRHDRVPFIVLFTPRDCRSQHRHAASSPIRCSMRGRSGGLVPSELS